MMSGAFVTTANSSGGSLPATKLRRLSQAESESTRRLAAAHCKTRLVRWLFCIGSSRARLLRRVPVFGPQQGVIQQRENPEGDRAVCDVEHIPIVAVEIKVKKVGNPAIDEPVDQVPDGAPDHKAETRRQSRAVRVPQPPTQRRHGAKGEQ